MYVKRLVISEVLGFSGGRKVDLTFQRPDGTYAGLTVLAGRNGSGKTSLLRCLALLLAGNSGASALAPNYPDWRAREERPGEISCTLQLNEDEVREALGREPRNSAERDPSFGDMGVDINLPVRTESKIAGGGRSTVLAKWTEKVPVLGFSKDGDIPPIEEPKNTTIESREKEQRWFAAGYGPFRRLSGSLKDAASSRSGRAAHDRFATLFSEEFALGESVSWLIGLHLRNLEGEDEAGQLLDSVLRLLGDGLMRDGYVVKRVNSQGLWVSRDGIDIPLPQMSDGYRTVTAMVLDVVRGFFEFFGHLPIRKDGGRVAVMLPGVVLIDEIDAHLHVSWQQRIGPWLKDHFPLVQFIVTTHSPYVCQGADLGGLVRLAGPDEDAPPEIVSDSLYQRIVYGSGDDAAMSELFGLDSPYSERAEAVRRELVQLEDKVFSGEATDGEVDRYRLLGERLTSSSSARVDEVAARLRDAE
ncbi:AAA family ATPase [Streptomyces sp. NPDC058867]|uniref:AAA family ATPase n=1 Tax=unclassified Streptomyces TaxID=2593676 RepID=UPI0036AE0197